jgi:hypothetical protein
MYLNVCEWNWPWYNLKYYPGTCLEGLRNTTKKLNQRGRFSGRDLSPGRAEYKAGVLTNRPRCSMNHLPTVEHRYWLLRVRRTFSWIFQGLWQYLIHCIIVWWTLPIACGVFNIHDVSEVDSVSIFILSIVIFYVTHDFQGLKCETLRTKQVNKLNPSGWWWWWLMVTAGAEAGIVC